MASSSIDGVRLFVAGDGFDYACMRIRGYAWRCGACKRGRLHSWDKFCKVCKRPVVRRVLVIPRHDG